MNTAQAIEDQFNIADDMWFNATDTLTRIRWAIVCDTLASLM